MTAKSCNCALDRRGLLAVGAGSLAAALAGAPALAADAPRRRRARFARPSTRWTI